MDTALIILAVYYIFGLALMFLVNSATNENKSLIKLLWVALLWVVFVWLSGLLISQKIKESEAVEDNK